MDLVDLLLIAGGGIDDDSLDTIMETMVFIEEPIIPPEAEETTPIVVS